MLATHEVQLGKRQRLEGRPGSTRKVRTWPRPAINETPLTEALWTATPHLSQRPRRISALEHGYGAGCVFQHRRCQSIKSPCSRHASVCQLCSIRFIFSCLPHDPQISHVHVFNRVHVYSFCPIERCFCLNSVLSTQLAVLRRTATQYHSILNLFNVNQRQMPIATVQ